MATYTRPQGNGIRVDDGFEQGMSIPFYYDPMIAKLICHAETREGAIEKTIRALLECEITGVEPTLGLCKFVMHHEAFRSGNFDTRFVEKYFSPEVLKPANDVNEELVAAVLSSQLVATNKKALQTNGSPQGATHTSKWKKNRLN